MDIRLEIRRCLLETLTTTQHFHDRTMERLMSQDDIRPVFPVSLYEKAMKAVSFLVSSVDFNPKKAYQVILFDLPDFFMQMNPRGGEALSQGNVLCLLVRGGEIRSIFFRRDPQKFKLMPGVNEILTFQEIFRAYNEAGKDKLYIDGKPKKKQEPVVSKYSLPFPKIFLLNKEYYVDSEKQLLIQAKNTSKVITFDQALETLPEDELNKLFALVSPAE